VMAEGLLKSAAFPVPSADPEDPAVPAKVVTVAPELLVLSDPPQDTSRTAIEMMIPTSLKRSFTITSLF